MFGIGQKFFEMYDGQPRSLPEKIEISEISSPQSVLTMELKRLSDLMLNQTVIGSSHLEGVVIRCKPFSGNTPIFVVEVSNRSKAIKDILAFVQGDSIGNQSFTVVPTQQDSGRVRVLLPRQSKGDQLSFIITYSLAPTENAAELSRGIMLRTLQ